jgi:Tfp pilus assembly PilM family ATPase
VGIGGHAITLSLQKHFGVPESEAKKMKAEKGLAPSLGNEECLEAMLTTVSAIRDEIMTHLNYWQSRVTPGGRHKAVTKIVLLGGNGSLRGLSEYFENSCRVPTVTGDVFTNFASHEVWLPDIEYREALAFATPIGLALRDYLV